MASDTSLSDAVLYEVTDTGVAVITLNRPERLNSWGADISAGVYARYDRDDGDPYGRVILLISTVRGSRRGA